MLNRPEIPGQSALDAGQAASLWKQHIEPKLDLGYVGVSPATTSDGGAVTWMNSFLAACTGCRVSVGSIYERNGQLMLSFRFHTMPNISTVQTRKI